MTTTLTKIQLVIFVIVTLIGGTIVGARYAELDRLFLDKTYTVEAYFDNSGGIFENAQVTYRGVGIGRVGNMTFTGDGVKVRLDIKKDSPKVPADVRALVANKSAVGEQYIDLQPRVDSGPYLDDDSVIENEDTDIPISTTKLLVDVNQLVKSIDTEKLQTLINELGTAFEGTGDELSQILDNTSAFVDTAVDNLDVTRSLIRKSGTVLQTQIDTQGQLKNFASDLALLSDTLVASDEDLRRLLDEGAPSAKLLRQVIAENSAEATTLLNNLVTVNNPIFKYIDGVHALFLLYPYIVDGAASVLVKDDFGNQEVHFGAVLASTQPPNCTEGYRDIPPNGPPFDRYEQFYPETGVGVYNEDGELLNPKDAFDREFAVEVGCADPALNPRGVDDLVFTTTNRVGVADYDVDIDSLTPSAADAIKSLTASSGAGKDSWKWLLIGPAASK